MQFLKSGGRALTRLIQEMEAREPALCEFFLEESTNLHAELSRLGLRPRRLRTLSDRIQSFGLTLVRSLRCAQLRLWDEAERMPLAPPAASGPDAGPLCDRRIAGP